eukprot:CAMPEP_0197724922 /NCGR_PEP_ID=MMETSP1434-20131217/6653_1 /TAXON_ID=265543 /ORGANISM="Minutocellus polymorphus, Strain CCMP3303" /LENGTH=43 /DNA_ID= /DNA_START= /DNA_END= /DNA_ORIENTATION=
MASLMHGSHPACQLDSAACAAGSFSFSSPEVGGGSSMDGGGGR